MKKTVLTFGLIGGAIMAAMMFATMRFVDKIGINKGEIIGYTTMIVARAFAVGILITVVACICYVVAWEIIYFNFMPEFADKYASYMIEKARASGASQQVIDAKLQQMKSFKAMYDNPFINAGITFFEPFPIGLIATLISAAILRKKTIAATRDDGRPAQLQVQ